MKVFRITVLLVAVVFTGCNVTVQYRPYNKGKEYSPAGQSPIVINKSSRSFDYRFNQNPETIIYSEKFFLRYKLIGDLTVEMDTKEDSGSSAIRNKLLHRAVSEGKTRGGQVIVINHAGSGKYTKTIKPYEIKHRYQTYRETRELTYKYKRHSVIRKTTSLSASLYRRIRSDDDVSQIVEVRRAIKKGDLNRALARVTYQEIMSEIYYFSKDQQKRAFIILDKRLKLDSVKRFNLAQKLEFQERLWDLYFSMETGEKMLLKTNSKVLFSAWSDRQLLQYVNDIDGLNNNFALHTDFIRVAWKQGRKKLKNKLKISRTLKKYDKKISMMQKNGESKKSIIIVMENFLVSNVCGKMFESHSKEIYKTMEQYQKEYEVLDAKSWNNIRARVLYSALPNSKMTLWLLKKGVQADNRVELTWTKNKLEYFGNYIGNISQKDKRKYLRGKFQEIKRQGHYWTTPLHRAARYDYIETVQYLLRYGAKMDAVDCLGIKAYELVSKIRSDHDIKIKKKLRRMHSLFKK